MADYHFVGEEVVKNSILQMLSFSQEKFQGEGAYVTVFVIQSLTHVRPFATPWTAAQQASLTFTNLLELAQTPVHRVRDAIQPSHPLLSLSPPAFSLSQHQGPFQ